MANWHTWHQKGVAGGEETRGEISKGLSADGRGSADAVRQHCRTRKGTPHQSAAVVYVAREAGGAGLQWDTASEEGEKEQPANTSVLILVSQQRGSPQPIVLNLC